MESQNVSRANFFPGDPNSAEDCSDSETASEPGLGLSAEFRPSAISPVTKSRLSTGSATKTTSASEADLLERLNKSKNAVLALQKEVSILLSAIQNKSSALGGSNRKSASYTSKIESAPIVESVKPVESKPAVQKIKEVGSKPSVEKIAVVESEPAVKNVAPVKSKPLVENVKPVESEPAVEKTKPVDPKSSVERATSVKSKPAVEKVALTESKSAVEKVAPVESKSAVEKVAPVESKPSVKKATSVKSKPAVEKVALTESKPTVENVKDVSTAAFADKLRDLRTAKEDLMKMVESINTLLDALDQRSKISLAQQSSTAGVMPTDDKPKSAGILPPGASSKSLARSKVSESSNDEASKKVTLTDLKALTEKYQGEPPAPVESQNPARRDSANLSSSFDELLNGMKPGGSVKSLTNEKPQLPRTKDQSPVSPPVKDTGAKKDLPSAPTKTSPSQKKLPAENKASVAQSSGFGSNNAAAERVEADGNLVEVNMLPDVKSDVAPAKSAKSNKKDKTGKNQAVLKTASKVSEKLNKSEATLLNEPENPVNEPSLQTAGSVSDVVDAVPKAKDKEAVPAKLPPAVKKSKREKKRKSGEENSKASVGKDGDVTSSQKAKSKASLSANSTISNSSQEADEFSIGSVKTESKKSPSSSPTISDDTNQSKSLKAQSENAARVQEEAGATAGERRSFKVQKMDDAKADQEARSLSLGSEDSVSPKVKSLKSMKSVSTDSASSSGSETNKNSQESNDKKKTYAPRRMQTPPSFGSSETAENVTVGVQTDSQSKKKSVRIKPPLNVETFQHMKRCNKGNKAAYPPESQKNDIGSSRGIKKKMKSVGTGKSVTELTAAGLDQDPDISLLFGTAQELQNVAELLDDVLTWSIVAENLDNIISNAPPPPPRECVSSEEGRAVAEQVFRGFTVEKLNCSKKSKARSKVGEVSADQVPLKNEMNDDDPEYALLPKIEEQIRRLQEVVDENLR